MSDVNSTTDAPGVSRLLAYGLLRRGLSLGGLLSDALPLGTRRVPGLLLYDLGKFPGAVPGDGEILAELFELPAGFDWTAMDEAEGLDMTPPLYRRQTIPLEDGPAWVYVYARPVDDARLIPSGDWLRRDA